jgi:transcriptional regulator with GAF, ATPase, and Fis domain
MEQPGSLALAHRRLTQAVSGAKGLDSILASLNEAARGLIPVHAACVLLAQGAEAVEVHVCDAEGPAPRRAFRRDEIGPALRPPFKLPRRIDRFEETPGRQAALDRELWEAGYRSVLIAPFPPGSRPEGALAVLSREEHAYRAEQESVLQILSDLVLLAVRHEHMAGELHRAEEERERALGLEARVEALKRELERTRRSARIIGESAKWKEVLVQAAKVAPVETTVLLTGESGTGKELVARFIHQGSPRERGPFVAINCATLQETLLESELFGHEKGAFTGAVSSRVGRIEQAAGGVLFLDEVGEMSPVVQAKLLRVLQEREYERLGASRTLKADVRVIAATNADLESALARGAFREDLYYRLRVFEIRLPALRERREDILPMAEAFLEEIGSVVGRPAAGISREARDTLLSYPWPGNVRELRNALERATILCDGGLITLEHLPIRVSFKPVPAEENGSVRSGGATLDSVERDLIVQALDEARNNRSQAARLLGITRSQLYSRIQKHGLRSDSGG